MRWEEWSGPREDAPRLGKGGAVGILGSSRVSVGVSSRQPGEPPGWASSWMGRGRQAQAASRRNRRAGGPLRG